MIGIKVYEQWLQLNPDTVVPWRLNSPIFNDDNIIEGSYTLPFVIPVGKDSPYNDALLGFPGLPENAGSKKEHPAEIFFDGLLLFSGILVIKSGSANQATANFKIGIAKYKSLLQSITIPELVREEIVLDAANLVRWIYIKPSGTASSPYGIRVNDTLYEEDTLSDLATAINAAEAEPKVTATYIDSGPNTPGGLTAPYIQLRPAFSNDPLAPLSINAAEDSSSARGHWLIDTFDFDNYTTPIATALAGYFDDSIPYPTDKIRFPYLVNTGLYTDDFTTGSDSVSDKNKRYPSINARNETGIIFNEPNTGKFNNINYNSLAPYVRLRYVIDKMIDEIGIDFEGDVLTNTDVNNILFYTSRVLDVPQAFIGSRPFIWWRRSFNLDELLPEMSCIELLKELQKLLNFALYVNEATGKVRMQFRKAMITSRNFIDITARVSPWMDYDDTSLAGIRLTQEVDDTDAIAKAAAADHIFDLGDDPESIISTAFSGFFFNNTFNVDDDATTLTGPFAIQRAQSGRAPRFIFYKGYTSKGTWTYPSAAAAGTGINLQLSNLFTNQYREWLRFLRDRRQYTYAWDIELPEILDLNWERKYRIDRVNYLLKSLSFDLTMKGISRPVAEFYTT